MALHEQHSIINEFLNKVETLSAADILQNVDDLTRFVEYLNANGLRMLSKSLHEVITSANDLLTQYAALRNFVKVHKDTQDYVFKQIGSSDTEAKKVHTQ